MILSESPNVEVLDDVEEQPLISGRYEPKKEKWSFPFFVKAIGLVLLSFLILAVLILFVTAMLFIPLDSSKVGMLAVVYQYASGNDYTVFYGKFNPLSGKHQEVSKVTSYDARIGLYEISTFDRDGNMYWSPGREKLYIINTINGNIEEKNIEIGTKINALITQPISSSVFAVISKNETDVGVYQIVKGNNERIDFPINRKLVDFHSDPTNMAVVIPETHMFVSVYSNQDETQELLTVNLLGEDKRNTIHVIDHKILSIGYEYVQKQLLAVAVNTKTKENSVVLFRNALNATENAVFSQVLPLPTRDPIEMSTFYNYQGKFFVTLVTKLDVIIYDLQTLKPVAYIKIPSNRIVFDAIQLNPDLAQ